MTPPSIVTNQMKIKITITSSTRYRIVGTDELIEGSIVLYRRPSTLHHCSVGTRRKRDAIHTSTQVSQVAGTKGLIVSNRHDPGDIHRRCGLCFQATRCAQ